MVKHTQIMFEGVWPLYGVGASWVKKSTEEMY